MPPSATAAPDASDLLAVALTLQLTIRNTGSTAGATVLQLYLRYPLSASEPPMVLRRYAKTTQLEPGQQQTVQLQLSGEDLSTWAAASDPSDGGPPGRWLLAHGSFTAFVGFSSRQCALSHDFEV